MRSRRRRLGWLCVPVLLIATAGPPACGSALREVPAPVAAVPDTGAAQPFRFGGAYDGLDARRQRLIDDWVARFNTVTGQHVEAGPFYDTYVKLSAKTTFDAVTHALMTTTLTSESGEPMGDALDLVDQVESLHGQVTGARGDRQFRMYVRLKEGALETLDRSREFRRGADNTVYHKGYPINYRQQGGVPSMQFSVALDRRRADIDVDYRSARFPAALFNGHLTAANSDVRAGANADRHASRWTGFRNWWRSFFGIRLPSGTSVDTADSPSGLTAPPRAGRAPIDVMVHDFLTAWLIEGNAVAAYAYISERAHACLKLESDDPSAFDPGMAPFILLTRLRDAHLGLGERASLDGLLTGVRLSIPELRVVDQPHHARFVIYDVPDDVAEAFDCESRLTLGTPRKRRRAYGTYRGAVFYVDGQREHTVALLWARENGYWKIVSWRAEPQDEVEPASLAPPPEVAIETIDADESFVQAVRGFLESWLVRKDYDAAFEFISPASYACYDLAREPDEPPAASPADAGRRIRAELEASGARIGRISSLDEVITAAPPFHPSIRVMRHRFENTFALSSIPDALAEAADCSARERPTAFRDGEPLEYGTAFGMTIRFLTRAGDPPVLRTLWRRENGAWRIAAYGVELP